MNYKEKLAIEIEKILAQEAKSARQKEIHYKLIELGEKFGNNAEKGIEPTTDEENEGKILVEEWKTLR